MRITEAPWYDFNTQQRLATARQFKEQADVLNQRIDDLVSPFAQNVMQQILSSSGEEKNNIDEMIRLLPEKTFHRSELRAAFIQKFGYPGE